jgi:hypothetical protein
MQRHFGRHHQHHVETHVAERVVGMRRQPGLRCGGNAALLAWRDRFGRVIESVARLDLDNDQKPAATRDDVDLADRRSPAPRQNAEALAIKSAAARLSAEIQ